MDYLNLLEELEIVVADAKSQQKHIAHANYATEYIRFDRYATQSAIIVHAEALTEAIKNC